MYSPVLNLSELRLCCAVSFTGVSKHEDNNIQEQRNAF